MANTDTAGTPYSAEEALALAARAEGFNAISETISSIDAEDPDSFIAAATSKGNMLGCGEEDIPKVMNEMAGMIFHLANDAQSEYTRTAVLQVFSNMKEHLDAIFRTLEEKIKEDAPEVYEDLMRIIRKETEEDETENCND